MHPPSLSHLSSRPLPSFLPTSRVRSFVRARSFTRGRAIFPLFFRPQLVRFSESLLLLRSPFRLSLPPHPPFASRHTPFHPAHTHTNPLPPPSPRPLAHTPAYLTAFSGVSSATLGKILPPVMSARVSTRRKFERVKIRAKLPTGLDVARAVDAAACGGRVWRVAVECGVAYTACGRICGAIPSRSASPCHHHMIFVAMRGARRSTHPPLLRLFFSLSRI
ncbi:hypothetical protein C8J57DRAFT_1525170 [Mycena rebaudengoi]|nr:hypothetical protein C8J57DRAFT_1525170 [Mycena rebaudengoi]